MSVASRNPFSLLDAEDSSSPAPAPAKAPAATPAAPAAKAQAKPRTGPSSRGGKYYARGGKPSADTAAQATDDAPADGQKKYDGGRGAPRGNRGRGAPRGGKGRPFDRHSATGKTDSHKKVHQGWGGDEGNTELKQEEAAKADAEAEVAPVAEGEATPADAEAKPRKEEEEEDNTLTLDQYLAKKAQQELSIPKIEATRQANDGADDLFKDAVPLKKDEEEEVYFAGKGKSAPKAKAKKEEKIYLEIDARFERPDRGAGRGGRGRGADRARGGERRGRGAPRAPRGGRQGGAPAPNVDDQTAFPSLA